MNRNFSLELLERKKEEFCLREIIDSNEFKYSQCLLPLALGVKTDGGKYVYDLTKMHNLLIAGSNDYTNNYDNVTNIINNIILSVLYKVKLEEVELVLFDTVKQMYAYKNISQLYDYEDIDSGIERVINILLRLVMIMEKRYHKYATLYVRDIEEHNAKIVSENKDKYIVVIISEFSCLMNNSNKSKEMEDLILKLSKFGKAVGIHLIFTIQNIYKDVITDKIRESFLSRLSFKTSSAKESKLILDCSGAEKLSIKGDMLFLPSTELKPIHLQCPYVSTKEVERVIKFLNKQNLLTKTKL